MKTFVLFPWAKKLSPLHQELFYCTALGLVASAGLYALFSRENISHPCGLSFSLGLFLGTMLRAMFSEPFEEPTAKKARDAATMAAAMAIVVGLNINALVWVPIIRPFVFSFLTASLLTLPYLKELVDGFTGAGRRTTPFQAWLTLGLYAPVPTLIIFLAGLWGDR